MGKKLTYEEFIDRLYSVEARRCINVLSTEYNGMKSQMEYMCTVCGHHDTCTAANLIGVSGCPECVRKQKDLLRRKSHEEFLSDMSQIHPTIIFLSKYDGYNNKISCSCDVCGYEWKATPCNLYGGHGCKRCGDKRTGEAQTKPSITIAEAMPYAIDYFVDKDLPYKYGTYSRRTADFCCPTCGSKETTSIVNYLNRTKLCTVCSDLTSMPNKVIRIVLSTLNIVANYEYSPKYLKGQFYDAYFELNDKKYAVEMDGGVGHGKRQFRSTKKDAEGLLRDELKNIRSTENNVNLIRIDCHSYTHYNFDTVKQAVIHSELAQIIDISSIDWYEVERLSKIGSITHDISTDYDSGMRIADISEKYKMDRSCIRRHLKSGTKFGWCNYNTKHSYKPVALYDENHVYVSQFESITQCAAYIKQLDGVADLARLSSHINTDKTYHNYYIKSIPA